MPPSTHGNNSKKTSEDDDKAHHRVDEKVEDNEKMSKDFKNQGGEDKDNDDEKEIVQPVGFFHLFRFSTCIDVLLIVIATCSAVGHGAVFPIVLLIFGELTDSIIELGSNSTEVAGPTPAEQIISRSKYYAIIGTCVCVIAFLQNALWNLAAERQAYRIRKKFYHTVLHQDMTWFDSHKSGELTTRFADDVDTIQKGMGEKLGAIVQSVAACIGCFTLAFFKSWQLTLVILSVSGGVLIPFTIISGKLIRKWTQKELDSYSKAGGIAEEVLSGIRTVVAFGGEEKEAKRYHHNLHDAKNDGIKKETLKGLFVGAFYMVLYSCYGLAFWYGSELVMTGKISPGDILVTFLSALVGCMLLGNSAPNFADLATGRGAAAVIWKIIDEKSSIDSSSEDGLKPDSLTGQISFKNVHFSYPKRKQVKVLNGLDLDVNVGQTVALVGSSGCGKSTTVQLIQRFYDPDSGYVSLDGHNLCDLNVRWLRENIGVVSQEPVLFSASIGDNIRYGNIQASMEDVIVAAKEANAHEFVTALPDGYHTLVGQRGAQLSGGQKQRIAIARALVRNPRILLLDEATSALDTESEALVQAALDKAEQGRTTIVIAHRLSTVKNADLICAFQNGVIVEKGRHDELMQISDGIYRGLVMKQSKKEEDEEVTEEGDKAEADMETIPPDHERPKTRAKSAKSAINGRLSQTFNKTSKSTGDLKEEEKEKENQEDDEEDYVAKYFSARRVLKLNASEWHYMLIGCLGSVVAGAKAPAFAVVFSKVLETFSYTDPDVINARIALLCGMFAALALASLLSHTIAGLALGKSGEELTLRLRHMTFKAMLRQDIGWFDDDKNDTGVLVARLATETSDVKGVTGARVGFILEGLCNMGVALIISFYYGWQLTFLVIGFLPFIALAGAINAQLQAGNTVSQKGEQEDVAKLVSESLDNIRTVVSLTREETLFTQYVDLLQAPYKKGLKGALVAGVAFGMSQGIIYFAYAAVFSTGGLLVEKGLMEFQNIFLIIFAIILGGLGLGRTISSAPDIGKAKVATANMFRLLDRAPPIDSYSNEGHTPPDDYKAELKFEKLRFSYPTRPGVQVLQGLTLSVSPGETLALVGSSGCGKSTTIQLTERFYDAAEGQVVLDSYNTKSLNISWLRSQIGLVSQEPVLFDCTIAENIAYGDNSRSISLDEIIEAAKAANIHEFINGLPLGYETRAGDRGTQLSGGQKQRIAIARALIRQPKILLLDEATSALDTESEKIVQAALDSAKRGRTCITIAHRLSTIHDAEKIAVIKQGQVAEMGTHSELMALKGQYYNLYTAQKLKH